MTPSTRSRWLGGALRVGAAMVFFLIGSGPARASEVRNVVLFVVDDLGWQDVAASLQDHPTTAQAHFRTPNLERLAARGLRFTQSYASAPVCTPTRTSLMTGRCPGRTRITYWTLHAGRDTSAPFPGLRPPEWNLDGLQPETSSLPRVLADAGFQTIHVGKAHWGAVGTPGADPSKHGFAINVAGHGAGAPGSFLGVHAFSAAHRGGSRHWDVPGLEDAHGKEVYLTEVLTERALSAVDDALRAKRRFFLHFATYAVHTPIEANPRFARNYDGLDEREAAYASMVESYDAALGALLDRLEGHDALQDTAIVFTSDNGGLSAHARGGAPHVHNAPLRSGKGSAYEGGLRVPLIVSLPGMARAGETESTPVISHDLYPTLLAIAGVARPEGHVVDGHDLTPLLQGEALAARSLYWNQPHFWGVRGPGIWPFSAVRRGDWKLIYRHADQGFELYDLSRDVAERVDQAPYDPERVAELARELSTWIEDCGAQLSIDARTERSVPLPGEALAARR